MTGTYVTTSLLKDGKIPHLRGQLNDYIAVPDSASATHAYAISHAGAEKLLTRMRKVSGIGHVDQLITYTHGRDFKKYAFVDGTLITQSLAFDGSMIGNGGSPYLGNQILDMFRLNRRGIRGGWMLSEPFIRLGDFQVAGWQILFFALGWLLGLKRLHWFAGLLLLDSILLSKENKVDWNTFMFNVTLFAVGGWLRKRRITR
jgi:hypothetical protein